MMVCRGRIGFELSEDGPLRDEPQPFPLTNWQF